MNTRTVNDGIDLLDLCKSILRKVHLVILAGILMAFAAILVTKLFVTPMYTSTTKMYVLSKQDSETAVTSGDLQVGSQLIKDYVELVKSRSVMEQVINILGVDMDPDKLSDAITVSNAADTRILSISVKNENPKLAKELADTVREVASVQIKDITYADSVNTVEEGNLPKSPSSPNTMKNAMFGGILGVLIASAVIIVRYVLDDSIKTPDDVEHYLELTVLSSIPVASDTSDIKENKKSFSQRVFRKE